MLYCAIKIAGIRCLLLLFFTIIVVVRFLVKCLSSSSLYAMYCIVVTCSDATIRAKHFQNTSNLHTEYINKYVCHAIN